MNKDSTSFRNSGGYSSPGTPDYADNGYQKGWCSERVPLPTNYAKQRRTSLNILMPYNNNNNGRTLPSKWEDAERWITSPVSGSGICKALPQPPQRRPKSKSGPLGVTPGDGYYSGYSPGFPLLEGGRMNGLFAGSPLMTGVLVPNGYSFHHGGIDENVASSVMFIESSYPDSQDEKSDGCNVSRVVSRRDMATQMSPVDSPESSPKGRMLLSTSPPPLAEPNSHLSAGLEVRDVQVDKRVTMTKQSKRRTKRMEKNGSTEVKELALTWSPKTDEAMELSKITAWENLQNAKAEASIRKLEMKLEKKKSDSMDKIMNKLKVAQMKAQEMRKSVSVNQAPRTTHKISQKWRTEEKSDNVGSYGAACASL
ncbi:hypothetical protein M8C21_007816 [Ambrosia artemisiifolia]|uniref:Remorin C-terminal domain-containing protein n=1 Tax=Ambrosia artemisiifolia TaxID=4212 RepID=A0AAD5CN87_AMBAR|nr:hypothetical protein M8C21_007816 [Ambrosia artemisiifolia]